MPDPRSAAWLPTPAEIRERAAISRWLRTHGFTDEWGVAVLIYESPSFDLVKNTVARHGLEKAQKLLQQYIDDRPILVIYEEDVEELDDGDG